MLGVTCYFDDSGSDRASPLVCIGGPALTRIQSKAFSARWKRLLTKHEVEGPLHIKDFVAPGRYCTWYPEFKRALFLGVSALINEHKFYSVSILMSQEDFNAQLTDEVKRNLIGQYAFVFFTSVLANREMVKHSRYFNGKISYLVDDGVAHKRQLEEAHSVILRLDKEANDFGSVGTFTFDSDDNVSALQAADAIAWASRRLKLDGSLPEGFEPLQEVLGELHESVVIPRDGIRMLADPVNNWIARHASIPSLADILRK